jgi:TRAP-type C4-dicarboxylate transport system substrate-binding protein
MRELWDRMNAESQEFVIAAGVQANEVNIDAFHRAARPLLEKYLQRQGLDQMYDSIRSVA